MNFALVEHVFVFYRGQAYIVCICDCCWLGRSRRGCELELEGTRRIYLTHIGGTIQWAFPFDGMLGADARPVPDKGGGGATWPWPRAAAMHSIQWKHPSNGNDPTGIPRQALFCIRAMKHDATSMRSSHKYLKPNSCLTQ